MKTHVFKTAILSLLLLSFSCTEKKKPGIIELKGVYHGKDLVIENPHDETGVGFCISEVYVNGQRTTDEINSASFEIDLEAMGLKEGDKVDILIKHAKGCEPLVTNAGVIE